MSSSSPWICLYICGLHLAQDILTKCTHHCGGQKSCGLLPLDNLDFGVYSITMEVKLSSKDLLLQEYFDDGTHPLCIVLHVTWN